MANVRFQNALEFKPQKTPPIWFMRQAGRYHSHYQNLRKKHSFEELCKIPELAAKTALGPVEEFDFDAGILFSDILFPLEALGFGLEYTEAGPRLGFKLSASTLPQLKRNQLEFLNFQGDAVKLTRELLPRDKSLIGFVGGPWTLFVYACEGGHSGSLLSSKSQMDLWPSFSEALLPLLEYSIQRQLDGGAEVVMIFDTAAGEVSPNFFELFLKPSLKSLSQKFPSRLGYYSKGTTRHHLGHLEDCQFLGVGVDHRWEISDFLSSSRKLESRRFIQGNFDQGLLFCNRDNFLIHLERFLEPLGELSLEERRGWICGLGHGVLPKTPEAHVHQFIKRVREKFS